MIDKGSLVTSFLIISDSLIFFPHHINAIYMIHKKNNVKYMCMLIKSLHEAACMVYDRSDSAGL